jgi:hypothetical protein
MRPLIRLAGHYPVPDRDWVISAPADVAARWESLAGMVNQMVRRTGHPLWVFACLLVVAAALLAYGWCRPAGAWHVEAPGPALSVPAIAAGPAPPAGQSADLAP